MNSSAIAISSSLLQEYASSYEDRLTTALVQARESAAVATPSQTMLPPAQDGKFSDRILGLAEQGFDQWKKRR